MSAKAGSRELIWIAAGGLGLFIVFFTVLYLRGDRNPVAQMAFKTKRLELVNAMRLSLAAASEAQNSAVMSTGEHDSKSFTEEARRATAALESGLTELEHLLKGHADSQEMELIGRFSHSLREFQQVDKQLLDLAVQNSNRKAYSLAFGPAMQLLKQMDQTLSRIVADHAGSASESNLRIVRLTDEIRIGTLRIQVLILPHIAEASDQKMDEFEAQLSAEDRQVRENVAALSPLLSKDDRTNIETTTSRYAEFQKLKSQIIELSRQNTDVRAVAIALNEKRKAMLACQDALVALARAIQAEPVTSTIPSGRLP